MLIKENVRTYTATVVNPCVTLMVEDLRVFRFHRQVPSEAGPFFEKLLHRALCLQNGQNRCRQQSACPSQPTGTGARETSGSGDT